MSSSSFDVYLIRKNTNVQTDDSISGELQKAIQEIPEEVKKEEIPHFKLEENVEKLVSAVQGDDETIRQKYRLIDARTRRFHSLIQSLKSQIDNQREELEKKDEFSEEDFQGLSIRFIRELAYSIDPASRHSKRSNLFGHQKFDRPIVSGIANYKSSVNENDDDESQKIFQSSMFQALYNYNGFLYLCDDNKIFYLNPIPGSKLSVRKSISLTYDGDQIGQIALSNSSEKVSILSMGPVNNDDKLNCIVKALGFENEINLKSLINSYDFSFVDVVLSLPNLTKSQADNLLTYLYRYNFLSAFVRSKICEFQLYLKGYPLKPWPELLGRFLSLLDPEWFQKATGIIDGNTKYYINVLKTLREFNPIAKFLFCIIVNEYEGMERGGVVNFIWSFVYSSILMNRYLGSDRNSQEIRRSLNTFIQSLQEKQPGQNTYINTEKIIKIISDGNTYKVPTTKFNPANFLQEIFNSHSNDMMTVLSLIPRTKEEGSPLFYPLVLEIIEALEKFDELDQMQSISDEKDIISNVETDSAATTQSDSRRRAGRSSRASQRSVHSSNVRAKPTPPSSTRSKRSTNQTFSSQMSSKLTENESDSLNPDEPLSASSSRSSRNRRSPRSPGHNSRSASRNRGRQSASPVQTYNTFEEEEYDTYE